MKRVVATLMTFLMGGFIYCLIELIYRGRTDISMMILAGCCSLVMAGLNNVFSFDMPFELQVAISSAACICGEYLVGITMNQNFTIWDYRNMWGTFAGGQLNVIFCAAWVLLSIIGIPLLDYMEWKFLNGEKPYYIICGKHIELWRKRNNE